MRIPSAGAKFAGMNKNFRAACGLSILVPWFGLGSLPPGCSDDPSHHDPPSGLSAELQADLQATLDEVVAEGSAPGVALYVSGAEGSWSGAAGLAEIDGAVPMAPDDRFRGGSILKTLVATAVLQEVEKGALDLHDVLTERLPPDVTARIEHADGIDVAMLLGHRSGIPDWVGDVVYQTVATDPGHVWSLDEILGLVEGQPPAFDPGASFAYSNTNYILLAEILSGVEGRSWREVLRERVIARAGMEDTTLPNPGNMDCPACAHGYVPMDGEMLDLTRVDPSMAGACGGHALVTTAADLARLLEQLRAGALFDDAGTLDTMLAFQPAPDPMVHMTDYGLGVMQLDIDGDIAIGHLGGTAGYQSFMLYVPATDRYVSGFINVMGDPSPVLLPTVARLAQP